MNERERIDYLEIEVAELTRRLEVDYKLQEADLEAAYQRGRSDEKRDSRVELELSRSKFAKRLFDSAHKFAALEAALTPFAEVGAAVAARPAYPPTQELMRVGEASFTVAHLIAAADVLAVRAEAVGTDTSKGGIAEIAKGEQE